MFFTRKKRTIVNNVQRSGIFVVPGSGCSCFRILASSKVHTPGLLVSQFRSSSFMMDFKNKTRIVEVLDFSVLQILPTLDSSIPLEKSGTKKY